MRRAAFRLVKPNWRESRTGKTTELKLFARARELSNSDLLMEVIVGANCNSVERLARCWHSLLLPEVQDLISTSQGTKVGQELRLTLQLLYCRVNLVDGTSHVIVVNRVGNRRLGNHGLGNRFTTVKHYFCTVYSKHRCSIITKKHKNLLKNTRAS